MKKKLCIVLSAMAITIASTSCSKEYNCHCVYTDNGVVTHEDNSKISEGSKDKSSTACKKQNASNTYVLGGNTYATSTECDLTN
jgi:hypothetical protein